MVSFFPLPDGFDYYQSAHWLQLLGHIQQWLSDTPNDCTSSAEQSWGTDLYWMAFFAAYPDIRTLPWEDRDPDIPLSDTFGERWLTTGSIRRAHESSCGKQLGLCTTCVAVCDELWEEFQTLGSLFYGGSILS